MAIRNGTFKVRNTSTGEKDEVMLKTSVEQVEGFDEGVDTKIKAFVGSDLTGMIIAYAGKDIPDGFLLCNGATISRTTYAKLFAKIGTLYGAGDGSTTFTLPNLIERFVEGGDSSTAGSYIESGLPNIIGNISQNLTSTTTENDFHPSGAFAKCYANMNYGISSDGKNWGLAGIHFDAADSNAIYGGSTTVQPNAVILQYLIKY